MSKSLTIGQVAAAIGVSAHTLRYYEQAGLLRSIGRSSGGHRLYSPQDLDWLQFVMRLKATGMPIAAIQAFSELRAQGESTYGARREMLAEHRDAVLSRLADLQANLAAITDKIAWYEAASLAVRHDDRLQTHEQEKDSSWNKHSTPPAPTATATSKAGKN
ncbi:MAG TPA: MerR family transcriptional regulator [Bordetella sp.]|uniref:MerR family transcriptional regulator n=1 Tax=Bordetella sp. TaxID=28081 RepID=UPI002ED5704E